MKALSIKQPWAWLILHGGKNIENRDWRTNFRGTLGIHASSRMTPEDYHACVLFCAGIVEHLEKRSDGKLKFPTFEELQTQMGGIVGEVEIYDCINESEDPWFTGRYGFLLRYPVPLDRIIPCRGMPGIFEPRISPQNT